MEDSGFPGLAEHRVAHRRMPAAMIQSVHSLQHGEGAQARQTLGSLRDEYLEHIESLNRAHGPWLKVRGIN